jgi:hypothetical protein
MAAGIDMPFGIDDLDKVFAVTDFLENKDELIAEFTPEVQKILVKKTFFTGHFKTKYNEMFDELITSLIRKQITKHFSFSPEEILILTDTGFLKMIAGDYFDQDNYNPKEGKTDESKNSIQ